LPEDIGDFSDATGRQISPPRDHAPAELRALFDKPDDQRQNRPPTVVDTGLTSVRSLPGLLVAPRKTFLSLSSTCRSVQWSRKAASAAGLVASASLSSNTTLSISSMAPNEPMSGIWLVVAFRAYRLADVRADQLCDLHDKRVVREHSVTLTVDRALDRVARRPA
jgi:hypothetical protein